MIGDTVTIALLTGLILVNAGFLVLLDRRDSRDRDERSVLLQRIQAPEQAVYEHAVTEHAEGSGLPMSDEQVAQMQEVEMLERIRQMEQADYDGRLA